MEKIGLIAGNRRFPFLFAEEAKRKGCYVVAVAVKKETSPRLKKYVDKLYWLELTQLERLFGIFHAEGISNLVMAGQINPRRLFSRQVAKDPYLTALLESVKDRRADSIFGAIARKLQEQGLRLLDSTLFLKEHLAKEGVLTRAHPSDSEWEDIRFGLEMAKRSASLDIGQAVAVKNKAIVAVEALEGTDNLIRRAGRLAKGGFTVAKVSKPQQDMRFDIPVIGPNTIKVLLKHKAACLALEAARVLFIDAREALSLADQAGLAVVAA